MTVEKQDSNDETELPKESSRITIHINISRELFRRLRIAASHNQLWLTEYVEQALEEAALHEASMIQRERRPVTRRTLEGLRKVSEEIMRDREGKLFEDSTEMIRQMREERSRYLEEL
ncbi:MAG TPA: hypothetical protein VFN02_10980 [Ktedonobacteraceae bacterium]|nr:hypothetical protein [Ktedonobacteraceae bacterium]